MSDVEIKRLERKIQRLRKDVGLSMEGRIPPELYLTRSAQLSNKTHGSLHGNVLEDLIQRRKTEKRESPASSAVREVGSSVSVIRTHDVHAAHTPLVMEAPLWWNESPLEPASSRLPHSMSSSSLRTEGHDAHWLEKCASEDDKSVLHFVGQVDALGPVVISCVDHVIGGRRQLVLLIRTVEGEQEICVDSERLLAGKWNSAGAKSSDAYELMVREAVAPVLGRGANGQELNFSLHRVPESREAELLSALVKQAQDARKSEYMFGVLRQCAAQTSQDEILRNDSSPAFDKFLQVLGRRVELLGFKGFRGGLDTLHGRMGTESVVAELGDLKVMYHVGPMLPKGEGKEQEIGRKRHIGNDVVLIVFQEGDCDAPYPPGCITSHFIHAVVVVRPTSRDPDCNTYRIAVQARKGVKPFEPAIPPGGCITADSTFTKWLFHKCVNAELSAMQAQAFSPLLRLERQKNLKDFWSNYGPPTLQPEQGPSRETSPEPSKTEKKKLFQKSPPADSTPSVTSMTNSNSSSGSSGSVLASSKGSPLKGLMRSKK